ncbi:DUF5839 family protein [Metabacillus fastidiosus]|uniref:DUF5839 family protein n=1 Tax=Metabacillus fastidiosus TaxID=1458 RepID=UPI003D29C53C
MENNNTIAGFHIAKISDDGIIKFGSKKLYHWHIPKPLRNDPIQQGDIVLVHTESGLSKVLVMNVFREEFEETKRSYKRVKKIIERAPKKECVSI